MSSMDTHNKELLNQDLKILFRFVSKSYLTIFLAVVGYSLMKTSNQIRELQVETCGDYEPYVTILRSDRKTGECPLEWIKVVTQCKKPFKLPYLMGFYMYGRIFAYMFGYKSDQGSPKTIMFRCFASKAMITFVFYLFSFLPSGVVYLYDFTSGYLEGTVLCSTQSLIGQWTSKHLTLFSTLIQSTGNLSRMGTCPIVVFIIMYLTNATNGVQIQLYIACFMFVFCVIWNYLIFDSPKVHKFIIEKERKEILKTINCAQYQVYRIPWLKIWGNKCFILFLVVRSIAKMQYLFFVRVVTTLFCTVNSPELYMKHFYEYVFSSICGGIISSLLADFLTYSGFFTKAGARKTFFFLFVAGNVPYYYFYLSSFEYMNEKFLRLEDWGFMVVTTFMNSFYFSAIACQHFDLSPTFASAQASIVFLCGEFVNLFDQLAYKITMEYVEYYINRYLLVYWMVIVVIMVPIMMINTCFNSFVIQDYNKCTRDVCKKESEVYAANIIDFQ